MKQLILAIALAAALGNAHAEQNAPSLSKVNGSLTAEAGKAYGDLDTVNGSITVEEKPSPATSRPSTAASWSTSRPGPTASAPSTARSCCATACRPSRWKR